jgi:flagellar biosynthesis protein FlhG
VDQAAQLRRLTAAADRPAPAAPATVSAFVIGSGKGGVGKSVLSALLALELARTGRRVLLLDGAQNQGNLHILLGVRPAHHLEALLTGEVAAQELLRPLDEKLWLLPADSGTERLHALGPVDRARLHHRLSSLYDDFDAVVVDSGPGIESAVRVALMRANRLAVVTVPEPAALSDAYALMKIVHLQLPGLPLEVLVNRVLDEDEGPATFERLDLAGRRFLGRPLRYLGAVPEDRDIAEAVRRPGRLLAGAPARVRDALVAVASEWLAAVEPADAQVA